MARSSSLPFEIPHDVQRVIDDGQAERTAALEDFGAAVAALRDDAVTARKESGIEDIWLACEEAYHGVDDKNRSQWLGMAWFKPTTKEGGLRRERPGETGKSTAFVRVTSRYVDAGTAKIGEITLPIDGQPFKLDPTPIPELQRRLGDETPVLDGAGQPMLRQAAPGEQGAAPPDQAAGQQPQGQPAAAPAAVPLRVKDIAEQEQQQAKDAAERASKRIYDWMVECKHVSQMRKVEFDMARLGTGVLKGPVPYTSRRRSVRKSGSIVELDIVQETKPRTLWVDPWNFFPARDCGEDIHEGSYCV